MVIQPKSLADAAALTSQNPPPLRHGTGAASAAEAGDAEESANAWGASASESEPEIDAATADQLMQSLAASMLQSPAETVRTHIGLESQAVLDLLQ